MSESLEERLFQVLNEYLSLSESNRAPSATEFALGLPDELRGPFTELARDYAPMLVRIQGHPAGTERIGEYFIESELGHGMSGTVFAARGKRGRRVAIKILHDHLVPFPKVLERFHQEADLLQRIEHPNIVRVLDSGVDEDRHFLVMERLTRGTLADRIHNRNRTDKTPRSLQEIRESCLIVAKVAGALDCLHQNNIVHRDIKPDNILFGDDDEPKLSDFGLARNLEKATRTESNERLGARAYMAPEWEVRPDLARRDPRVDVFSLGIVLFEACTGRLPFTSTAGLIVSPPKREALRISGQQRNHAIRSLEAIVERCLDYPAKFRYDRSVDMRKDLVKWSENRAVEANRLVWRRRLRHQIKRHPVLLLSSLFIAILIPFAWKWWANAYMRSGAISNQQAAVRSNISDLRKSVSRLKELITLSVDSAKALSSDERNDQQETLRGKIGLGLETTRRSIEDFNSTNSTDALFKPHLMELHRLSAEWHELEGRRKESELAWNMAASIESGPAVDVPDCTFSLSTVPDGARAELFRIQPVDGQIWKEQRIKEDEELTTPMSMNDIEPGSYLLEITRPGNRRKIRYPFVVSRTQPWVGSNVYLPTDDEIGEGWIYIPPGPFTSGGDRRAINGTPLTWRTLDGFFIMETELSFREYFEFLEHIDPNGHFDMCPCAQWFEFKDAIYLDHVLTLTELPKAKIFYRMMRYKVENRQSQAVVHYPMGGNGGAMFPPGGFLIHDVCRPDLPNRAAHSLDYASVRCYLAWRNRRAILSDEPWEYSLPTQWQWEKAARGVDGRCFAWGNQFDWSNVFSPKNPTMQSTPDRLKPIMKRQYCETDRSIYGLWDMCSVAREFVSSRPASALEEAMLCGGEDGYRGPDQFRLAGRSFAVHMERNWNFGFRLVKRLRSD